MGTNFDVSDDEAQAYKDVLVLAGPRATASIRLIGRWCFTVAAVAAALSGGVAHAQGTSTINALVWTAGQPVGMTRWVQATSNGAVTRETWPGLVVAAGDRFLWIHEVPRSRELVACECLRGNDGEELPAPKGPASKCRRKKVSATQVATDLETGAEVALSRGGPVRFANGPGGSGGGRWATEIHGQVGPLVLTAETWSDVECFGGCGPEEGGGSEFGWVDVRTATTIALSDADAARAVVIYHEATRTSALGSAADSKDQDAPHGGEAGGDGVVPQAEAPSGEPYVSGVALVKVGPAVAAELELSQTFGDGMNASSEVVAKVMPHAPLDAIRTAWPPPDLVAAALSNVPTGTAVGWSLVDSGTVSRLQHVAAWQAARASTAQLDSARILGDAARLAALQRDDAELSELHFVCERTNPLQPLCDELRANAASVHAANRAREERQAARISAAEEERILANTAVNAARCERAIAGLQAALRATASAAAKGLHLAAKKADASAKAAVGDIVGAQQRLTAAIEIYRKRNMEAAARGVEALSARCLSVR